MRCMSLIKNNSHRKAHGFTLVEVVVIAPILILVLGGFVVALVTMVGDTLASRDANALVFSTQSSLDRIEQDVRLATGFQSSSGIQQLPQGQDANYTGTASFTATATNHLIMAVPATTVNPLDSSRQIVYYANQPNPCGGNQSYNTPLTATVIYFVYNNALYRRVIMPNYTLTAGQPNTVCAAPWQQNSCSPGYTNARCQTQDSKLLDNVSSLDLAYYSNPMSTSDLGASNAASAVTLGVTINTSRNSSGQTLTHSANLRATRINSTVAATSVPLAFTTQPVDTYAAVADTNITFTAVAPNNPTYTWERSTNNGSSWSVITGATSSTLTIPSVDMTWNGNKFRAVAIDEFGRVITSNTATLTVGLWGSFAYENNWRDYAATTYPGGQYTKTSAGLVVLRGLVAGGTESWNNTIATLPPEYRPANRMMFYVGSYTTDTSVRNSSYGRVDILPTGEVKFMTGSNTWVALDQIRFMANGAPCSISTDITPLLSGWVNYASGYDNLSVCRNSSGIIVTKGLVRSGTSTSGTQIGAMPAGYQSLEHRILPAADGQSSVHTSRINNSIGIYSYSTGFVARGKLINYLSANNIYAANNGAVTWQTPSPVNGGWVTYSSSFATLQYGKTSDNIVMLKGLVKDGATAPDTVIFRLPSGFRPSKRVLSSGVVYSPDAAKSYMEHARIDVDIDGDVILHSGANSSWTSFDAINFYADGN